MGAFHEQRQYSGSYHLAISSAHEMDFLAHYHGEFELFCVTDGVQKMGINNQVLSLSAGQIGVAAPWHIHYYEPAGAVSGFMLIFTPDLLDQRLPQQSTLWTFADRDCVFQELATDLQRLLVEMTRQDPSFELAATSLLYHFFAGLQRSCGFRQILNGQAGGPEHHLLMQDILSYLARHFRDPIDRGNLADRFGISPSHFSRVFKAATGLPLTEYLARLRVEQVRDSICFSQESITDIALNSGFDSIRTFNRCFRRFAGCSPSELRQQVD